MPFYWGSRARSVPEYLKLRFDEKTRALNALTFAGMTVFSSGISMYALGLLLRLILGWSFTTSVLCSAAIVLAYTFLGGLTSAIYNEVLQFFLIVMGFSPLAIMAVMKAGGWSGMSRTAVDHDAARRHERRRDDPQLEVPGAHQPEPHGDRGLRPGDGARLRHVVRLLVYGLPGDPARHGGQLDVGLAAHAGDRGAAEDDDAVHRDRARHRGAGALPDGGGLRAADEERRPGLRPGADHPDGASFTPPECWASG